MLLTLELSFAIVINGTHLDVVLGCPRKIHRIIEPLGPNPTRAALKGQLPKVLGETPGFHWNLGLLDQLGEECCNSFPSLIKARGQDETCSNAMS